MKGVYIKGLSYLSPAINSAMYLRKVTHIIFTQALQ